MDGITRAITQGNPVALKLVKTALTTPTLINEDPTQGMRYAIPLECETYDQSGSAQVSESLVIIRTGKQNVTDNVAPGAWSWDMSGYIPGNKLLEPTNYFTPFVKLNTDILKQWFKSGAVLVFKDIEARLYKRVVIQSLRVSHNKECLNMAPFTMTLKEINVMEDGLVEETKSVLYAMADTGSKIGETLSQGMVIANASTATLAFLLGM